MAIMSFDVEFLEELDYYDYDLNFILYKLTKIILSIVVDKK